MTRLPSSMDSGLHEYPYHPNTPTLGFFIRSVCLFQAGIFVLCTEHFDHRKEAILWKTTFQKEYTKKKKNIKIELQEYLLNFRISKYTWIEIEGLINSKKPREMEICLRPIRICKIMFYINDYKIMRTFFQSLKHCH